MFIPSARSCEDWNQLINCTIVLEGSVIIINTRCSLHVCKDFLQTSIYITLSVQFSPQVDSEELIIEVEVCTHVLNLLKLLVANNFLANRPLLFGKTIDGNCPVAASINTVYGFYCLVILVVGGDAVFQWCNNN